MFKTYLNFEILQVTSAPIKEKRTITHYFVLERNTTLRSSLLQGAVLATTIHQAATALSCIISGQSTDEMYLVTGVQCGKQHCCPCGRTVNVFVFGFQSVGTKEPERER